MTDEEKQSLQLIAYRLGQLESGLSSMKEDTKMVGQIMSKLRLDEEVLAAQRVKIKEIEHRQKVTDIKQDDRIQNLETIVLPNHIAWQQTADDLRKFMVKITAGVLTAVAGMAGIVGLK